MPCQAFHTKKILYYSKPSLKVASGPFFHRFIVTKESALFDGVSFLISANQIVGKILIECVDTRSEGFKERFIFHSYHPFPSVLFYRENKPGAAKIKPAARRCKGMNALFEGAKVSVPEGKFLRLYIPTTHLYYKENEYLMLQHFD